MVAIAQAIALANRVRLKGIICYLSLLEIINYTKHWHKLIYMPVLKCSCNYLSVSGVISNALIHPSLEPEVISLAQPLTKTRSVRLQLKLNQLQQQKLRFF